MPAKPAQIVLFVGPARSGKTQHLVEQYRAALDASPPHELGRSIWLAPNGRTAAAVRQQLIASGIGARLSPGVLTFNNLAANILARTNIRLTRLSAVLRRDLLRHLVADALAAGILTAFAESANRPAFIEAIGLHFAELTRRNISPAQYSKTARRATSPDAHRELAQLYRDYAARLEAQNLIDEETALAKAAEFLANDACPDFAKLRLVVVDGFSDFTGSQLKLLKALAERTGSLLMSLPGDGAAPREELFSKSAATLEQLKCELPRLEIRQLQSRPSENAAIGFLEQHIFRHPKQVPSPSREVLSALSHFNIIEAASAHDEINQIARRVKQLLLAGSRPAEILVVFRSLHDVAPRVREVFDRFGIPYAVDTSQLLIAAPVIKTLLGLLRLTQNDWPFRQLIAVLTNNSLTALEPDARRSAEWLVRDLQIASGHAALLHRVRTLAATPPEKLPDHVRRRVAEAKSSQAALQHLSDALAALPAQATPIQWSEALTTLGSTLGLWPFTAAQPFPAAMHRRQTPADPAGDSIGAMDIAAWQSLTLHLAAIEQFDLSLGSSPRQLSLTEFLALLLDITTNEQLPRERDETGRVRILSAPAARNCSCRHLFLGGMSEQSFPSPERAGQLASDADYRNFNTERKNSATRSAPAPLRGNCEMLLFYEVITRAEASLTLSYPALDDKAQVLPPSPYIIELRRVVGDTDSTRRIDRALPNLRPIQTAAAPYNIPEWRTQALAQAIEPDGKRPLLAGILACDRTRPIFGAIDGGLRTVHARARGESFGPCEGLLASPAVAAKLAERFGPRHTWSASQWETYAACPFRFFMEQVLRLQPLGDLVLETDFARRGSRLHDVLAEFHRQWLTARSDCSTSSDEEADAFLAHLQEVVKRRTASRDRVGVDAALLELDQRQILKWAQSHFANHSKYNDGCQKLGVPMSPKYFEFRFGSKTSDDSVADPSSSTDVFQITIEGEPIRITGQIDRIDVGTIDGKTVFNVIDYKSGRRPSLKKEQLDTGEQLQLPIYVEAAQALIFQGDATPLQAGYWGMAGGFDSRGALAARCDDSQARWKETNGAVHKLIADFVAHIRHGDFPVASRNDKCTSTCDYNTVCRVGQVRNIGKTWWPEPQPGS